MGANVWNLKKKINWGHFLFKLGVIGVNVLVEFKKSNWGQWGQMC